MVLLQITGNANKQGGVESVDLNHSHRLFSDLVQLLGGVFLVFTQELWPEFDVSRLVHSMYVSETGSDGEVG